MKTKKSRLLRKAYLKTIYNLDCNSNTAQDYEMGLTEKQSESQQDIIEACFSAPLNLDRETGARLFTEYSVRNTDLRCNEFWKALVKSGLNNFDLEGLEVVLFQRKFRIFNY